ncbi:hypothetical protein L3X38_039532 [Prunus dulcis]|uniref:IST1-like protein n=1 Tax=Prunus dulcis TaxID=3755 RepID=A0AAD4YSN5_PRUDU|nr:hypothetical protein L3X38_039532 [Prunus dulcis]
MLIDKLSVRTPTGEVKLKLLKEIAKEYQVEWDTSESEQELLKPPEELIQGPSNFVSATSMPLQAQSVEPNKPDTSSRRTSGGGERGSVQPNKTGTSSSRRTSGSGERGHMHFADSASAAEAAAKSANDAMAAAQVAAYLANSQAPQVPLSVNNGFGTPSGHSTGHFIPDGPPVDSQNMDHQSQACGIDRSHSSRNEETVLSHGDEKKFVYRRYSYNAPSEHSDIRFDESDCDEEVELEAPPNYDALAARFDALKFRKPT